MSKGTSDETYISYSHRSEGEHELCLTFTPKPSQAVCYCPDTHPCTEFTQGIQSLDCPIFDKDAVRMKERGSKNPQQLLE